MSSTIQNTAAYLDTPGQPLQVREAPMPTPNPDEVLIKVHAVAINPADGARWLMGAFNPSHPWIFGSDTAGTIEGVGSDVTGFKRADRVIASSDEFFNHQTTNSAFQSYMKVAAKWVAKIPESTSFTDAVVLPLGLSTAAGMMFESVTLDLRLPLSSKSELEALSSSRGSAEEEEVLTIWGGSSSLGVNALQMGHAAGYRVIGIASARNFDLMKSCGADACFDYTDSEMEEKLVSFVQGKGWKSVGVAAAAGFIAADEAEVAKTKKRVGDLANRLGGRRFVSTCLARGIMPVPDMPDGVEASNCLALSEEKPATYIWTKFIPEALESGLLRCMPPARVVGEGLESVSAACEAINKGVSGQKLVVKIR